MHIRFLLFASPVTNFGHLMGRTDSLEKALMLGKIEGRREKEMTGDEMVGCHHRLNGHDFEQTLGDSEKQRSLECCNPGVTKIQTQLSDFHFGLPW